MTTLSDAFAAGVDAVIADNTLNRGGFVDAMQTVLVSNFSNAEGNAFVDALAVLYNSLNQTNNPTYNNLRGDIIDDGDVVAKAKYEALAVAINALPEAVPGNRAAQLVDLRDERDNIQAALDRVDVLIAAEPNGVVGRLVKREVLRKGKDNLRGLREAVRQSIKNITGDPDS